MEMDTPIEQKFDHLAKFLAEHIEMVNNEPFKMVPDHLTPYPAEWIEEFESKPLTFLYEVDTLKESKNIQSESLRQFIEASNKLSELISFPPVPPLKNKGTSLKGINGKKLHEISIIHKFLTEKEFECMLEIGGGKGNLSYIMCLLEDKKAVSVDMESEF